MASAVLVLAACNSGGASNDRSDGISTEGTSIFASEEGQDSHSYARPLEARVTHVSLDLNADFEAQRMVGSATLDLDVAEANDLARRRRATQERLGVTTREVTVGARGVSGVTVEIGKP